MGIEIKQIRTDIGDGRTVIFDMTCVDINDARADFSRPFRKGIFAAHLAYNLLKTKENSWKRAECFQCVSTMISKRGKEVYLIKINQKKS